MKKESFIPTLIAILLIAIGFLWFQYTVAKSIIKLEREILFKQKQIIRLLSNTYIPYDCTILKNATEIIPNKKPNPALQNKG